MNFVSGCYRPYSSASSTLWPAPSIPPSLPPPSLPIPSATIHHNFLICRLNGTNLPHPPWMEELLPILLFECSHCFWETLLNNSPGTLNLLRMQWEGIGVCYIYYRQDCRAMSVRPCNIWVIIIQQRMIPYAKYTHWIYLHSLGGNMVYVSGVVWSVSGQWSIRFCLWDELFML